jgi:hypothetical protein
MKTATWLQRNGNWVLIGEGLTAGDKVLAISPNGMEHQVEISAVRGNLAVARGQNFTNLTK